VTTGRSQQLASRRAALQARVAADRQALGEAVGDVQSSVLVVDRIFGLVQRVRQRPVALAVGGGLLMAVVVGRYRAIRWVFRGLALATAARHMGAVVRDLSVALPEKPADDGRGR
jgi:hypothetical protein